MQRYKNLTEKHIKTLVSQGCGSEDWDNVKVSDGFDPSAVRNCYFKGIVRIGDGVFINNVGSCIANYTIEDGAYIENVSCLEVTGKSSFGNGVLAAVVNEGGGREVPLLDNLTAQTAYTMAVYRHREKTIERMNAMAAEYALSVTSPTGVVGKGSRITNSGIIRNVKIGAGAVIEGATILSNGSINCTSEDPSFIGAGAKLYDFIVQGKSEVDGGSKLRRCFVGEGVQVCGLTGTDSMFFANSHFENGEVCSIFAGPFTVSHHKSSLLIAGMFSFFNAGSGSNQSNHLFKTGAVHQGIHRRGCKFASDAYIVLPARTGAYTIVLGRHKSHHDTENFPYSYLTEENGQSWLAPGINLANFGTVRDLEKWHKRDRRGDSRADLISFEEHNPFITEKIIKAIVTAEELLEKDNDEYVWKGIRMRRSMLSRGRRWYVLARDKFLGAMLAEGGGEKPGEPAEHTGPWIDAAGMYMTKQAMDALLDDIEGGRISSFAEIRERFASVFSRYKANAHAWAMDELAGELGHDPSPDEIAAAIKRGCEAAGKLRALTDQDRNKDRDVSMSVGYGLDSDSEEERLLDYRNVRGL